MNKLEESFHIDNALRQLEGSEDERNKLISNLRDLAIEMLEPILKKIPRNLPGEIIAAYKAKGISLEWNLKSTDVYDFCFMARRQTNPLIQSKKHALELLEVCTRVLDDEVIIAPELARKQIVSAYAMLDSNALDSGKQFSKSNSIRAKKTRGKVTDEGITLNGIIKKLIENPEYAGYSAKELWLIFLGELNSLKVNYEEAVDSLSITYYLIGSVNPKRKSFKTFQCDLSKFKSH